jgi:predicted permease
MMRDIGQSARRLLRRPALGITAVVTLAVAIGANTAIFSLLDTVALRPLPYPGADRLVHIGAAVPGLKDLKEVSWPRFQALVAQGRGMAACAAYYESAFGLTEKSRPEQLTGARVSGGFFAVWGVRPLLGRTFSADEQRRGGHNVVLLSHGFWRQRYGGDRAILGKSLDIEGLPTTVIGVLPDALRFPFGKVQVWLPRPDDASFLSRRAIEQGSGYLQVDARLAAGVSLAAAQQEMDRIVAAYRQSSPEQGDVTYPLVAKPMDEILVGTTRTSLLLLLAAVGLVLLIACADEANLLLADGLSRRREIAVCLALGASRRRIFGQALRESLLIAGVGGALGTLLAWSGLKLLVAASPAELPRLEEVSLSGHALAFAVLITTLAGILAGLAPAWQTFSADPKTFLVEAERGTFGGRRATWGQGMLVAGQIALALALSSAAGLLLRSLQHVNQLDLGFAPDNLLFVQATLPDAKYPGVTERRVFFEQLLDRVRGIPGVQSAALVEYPPTVGAPHASLTVEGEVPESADRQPLVLRLITSAGYFKTLGTRLLAGHDFDPRIPRTAPLTAIISRSLARQFFRGLDPLGRRLFLSGGASQAEIVGIVDDIQQVPLETGKEPTVFLFQHQVGPETSSPNFMNLAIRTHLPVASVAAAIRREVNAIDPGEPLRKLVTMSQLLATATARRRLTTGLFSGLSGLALLLSVLGTYGVLAHSILLRRREIGVRMALGATSGRVLGDVLTMGARWIVPGLACGVIGSYFAGRAVASQLFEVPATDWGHFLGAAALLAGIALLACLLPARKALRIDPATTLRTP